MELHEVKQIYLTIKDSKLNSLSDSLIKAAIRYSRLRTDWYIADQEGKNEIDTERRYAHNAFISSCDILARNMHTVDEDNNWRNKIGQDRKSIGDFACLLNAVIGILAR